MREHRVRITRELAGITAQVKARRHAFLTIFLPIWLTLWTIGGIVAMTTVITGTDRQPFLLLWLAGWLIGETMALVVFLWTTFGEELISIRNGIFTYQRHVFGIGPKRECPVHEVFNVRAAGFFGPLDGFNSALVQYGMTGGTVAVDNKHGEAIRFGIALNEYEAQNLAAALQPYFANTGSVPGQAPFGGLNS